MIYLFIKEFNHFVKFPSKLLCTLIQIHIHSFIFLTFSTPFYHVFEIFPKQTAELYQNPCPKKKANFHHRMFFFRYPFKSYQRNVTDFGEDDDDDELIDVFGDDDDNEHDGEQTINDTGEEEEDVEEEEEEEKENRNEGNNFIPVASNNLASSTAVVLDDDFISDDEESDEISDDVTSSINVDDREMFTILQKTHTLLARIRKMVKIIRNIGVLDQFVRNHRNGPKGGLILDMRVSRILIFKFELRVLMNIFSVLIVIYICINDL